MCTKLSKQCQEANKANHTADYVMERMEREKKRYRVWSISSGDGMETNTEPRALGVMKFSETGYTSPFFGQNETVIVSLNRKN